MHPRANLTNPYAIDRAAFGKAVQSNKVYLPQEVLLVSTDLASRQINAIRYAATSPTSEPAPEARGALR